MDSAQELFVSESMELLEAMESALLNLETNPDDAGLINAIFRAAHTIKGTSGVFGYDTVEAFTHVAENVLDEVRAGKLAVGPDLIAILLRCRDHMAVLVERAVAEQALSEAEQALGEELKAALQKLLGGETPAGEHHPLVEQVAEGIESYEGENAVVSDNWHISVRFDKEVLRNGMDPLSFLRFLGRLGTLRHVSTLYDLSANLTDYDPEACYVGLEIDLDSEAEKAEIEDVFEFVREDCTLHILPPRSSIEHYVNLIQELPEDEMRIGEMLLEGGALTRAELDEALNWQTTRQHDDTDGNEPAPALGEVLVEKGMVHEEVVEAAANRQEQVRGKISAGARSMRVDADKLDQLVNLVGEMVIAGAGTNLIARSLGNNELTESMSVLSRLVEEIRDNALRLRMVQIGDTFKRFQRVVRDVSRELDKEIVLEISGAETELDKTVVEKIGDPLMHLVRNAMDHGLEAADVREQHGKPRAGRLKLNAYHDSGSIVIEVKDDGAGLHRERIVAKAIERGLIEDDRQLSDQEVYRLIFEPGFSTAGAVTNLSGRGVGMDVVKRNIEALRGSVDVDSRAGEGTTVLIRLPLTLAIIDGFLVGVGAASYVIPLDLVFECVELSGTERAEAATQNYINLRSEVLPLLRLDDHFGVRRGDGGRENIVVVQSAGVKAGLVVDELLGELQTVIKPLGKIFRKLRGISGSTILGSGEVSVILDVPELVNQAAEQGLRQPVARQAAAGQLAGEQTGARLH